MLSKVSKARHAVVGLGVAAMGALGGFSIIGAGDEGLFRPEHFDAKQVVVQPVGDPSLTGVRIREVVDADFGVYERHGYERIIPHDFGIPDDIVASSPGGSDIVDVVDIGFDTRVRIGDPNVTVTGQHRYLLEYTLPSVSSVGGRFALDVIGTDETFATDRFDVVVVGMELEDPRCDVGGAGDFGGCTLEREGTGTYRVVFEPLEPGDGITISGTVDALVAADVPSVPPRPEPNTRGFRPLGIVLVMVGAATAAAVFGISRRIGSNEVFGGGGAAEAAFGGVPLPSSASHFAGVPTLRVPDSRLAALATIEFVPPRGVTPWQGNVLLRERVDDEAVSAWFSEMVARDVITVTGSGSSMKLKRGSGSGVLNAVDRAHVAALFSRSDTVKLGTYSKSFTKVWSAIRAEQRRIIGDSGWWQRPIAGSTRASARRLGTFVVFAALAVVALRAVVAPIASALLDSSQSAATAVVATVVVVGVISFLAYRTMLPSRTANGSALTLRTESFRRFLAASEGQHVDWAWDQGLIREYSAWAVALGAADAWSAAIESSNIPDRAEALAGPLLIHSNAGAFRSTTTAPSSSGSGGSSSGFSGGGVGGGGGGGSSGSW